MTDSQKRARQTKSWFWKKVVIKYVYMSVVTLYLRQSYVRKHMFPAMKLQWQIIAGHIADRAKSAGRLRL